MSSTHFGVTATSNPTTDPILVQPDNEILIARSSSASDTTQTLTAYGSATRTAALSGKREVKLSGAMTELSSYALSAACAGTVYLYRPGTVGDGDVRFNAVPTDGQTIVLGLTGYERTYTFRNPGRATILCLESDLITQGDYLDLTISGVIHRYWFNIDGAGTGAPSAPGGGGTLTMVDILSGGTDSSVASALETAIEATTGLVSTVSTNTVTVTRETLGTFTAVDGTAATGFTFTLVAGGTADAANQIRTGWTVTGSACSTDDTAIYLDRVLNADGTAGTDYGTGTTAHADLTATGASGAVVEYEDRFAIDRLLEWNNSSTSTADVDVRTPVNGISGDLVLEITIGNVGGYDDLAFDNQSLEVLANASIPASVTFDTDAIYVGGKPWRLEFKHGPVTASAIVFRLMTSTDSVTYHYLGSAITLATAGAGQSETDPPYGADYGPSDYIKLRVITNTNVTDVPFDARAIFN